MTRKIVLAAALIFAGLCVFEGLREYADSAYRKAHYSGEQDPAWIGGVTPR